MRERNFPGFNSSNNRIDALVSITLSFLTFISLTNSDLVNCQHHDAPRYFHWCVTEIVSLVWYDGGVLHFEKAALMDNKFCLIMGFPYKLIVLTCSPNHNKHCPHL